MATDRRTTDSPVLEINGLDVYYGSAHALQGVSLVLDRGVLAVVGRNGMGKSTLCNAVTGLVPGRGSIKLHGQEILGRAPHIITDLGIGYVPQGRRVWPSLSVDEHLRLASRTARQGDWTVARVYETFPRLAQRKSNGGAQLSGGEQQMLAIGRALLLNPRLLVMDEPTEGLAPVIVDHVVHMLKRLVAEDNISILLIEQNIGVAIEVADTVAVLVNGSVAKVLPAADMAADRGLQQRLLGVRSGDSVTTINTAMPEPTQSEPLADGDKVFTVKRAHAPDPATVVQEWPSARAVDVYKATHADKARVFEHPVAAFTQRAAYIVGTFDTKATELFYLSQCIERLGIRTVTVDVSTSALASPANVHPREVARHHPQGEAAVLTGDRGASVSAMSTALANFIITRGDLGGIIGAGGSGGTALVSAAMRALPVGVPKVMVSTMASGDVRAYVGPSDICMMYSVTDVSGLNRISRVVLANAAHALAGMLAHPAAMSDAVKPAIGLTMFGVTTVCVQAVTRALSQAYDCLVFHATGTGGNSMEKLVESGFLAGVIDVSTTEIADEIGGGVFSAGPNRLDTIARAGIPYVGACGALDMVNFMAMDSVPLALRQRKLYRHNDNVTLMRTSPEENVKIGGFLVAKLNSMTGPVRFFLPEGGVSALDAPGQPFWDPVADQALFSTIEQGFRSGPDRKLVRLPYNVNDPRFSDALVAAYNEIARRVRPKEPAYH